MVSNEVANSPPSPGFVSRQHPAVQTVVRKDFANTLNQTLYHFGGGNPEACETSWKTDLLFAGPEDNSKHQHVFHTLRWGGQFVCAGYNRKQINELEKHYGVTDVSGFVVEQPTSSFGLNPLPFNLPGMTRRCHYFIARKIVHFLPHEFHKRFTFDVWLEKAPQVSEGYVVRKRIPTHKRVLSNMAQRFPDVKESVLSRRAQHLIEQVFPMILTREVAILRRLQKIMPPHILRRLPTLAGAKQNEHGLITELDMHWIRMGIEPIPHMAFASEASQLLKALHDIAGIWHLDLRLDNMLITREGVAFIDFGSAVLANEDLSRSKILYNFYNEVMKTSEIQRVLLHMVEQGQVTCPQLKGIYGKVDPLVDTFYLAVQMVKPTKSPDLSALIDFDPDRPEAKQLLALTRMFINPKPTQIHNVHDAASLLTGVERIQQRLNLEKVSASLL